ncbi:MarR family transcriptional regulator [Pseudomonas sp. Bout1]|uniref:MarR family winged helix-turn-helix transcriptional regulator n=2 Tax=Pseudomonas sp. Bout1 TaxID=3048600 RepID=UPI002AB395A9|nr:MarR family transcriptional regulator [Pseudomonas sp. Bout1]MDY7532081.1 MarR family transcriptional regulator [Pseudomonas sp. Bout1]MEB0183627.1 MarR family transcriptional regulator [Pseudomonas sp. Bout1]
MRRASRRMAQIYDEAFVPFGLKATQYSLLNHIANGDGPKMRDLAQSLVMDLSALGHTLKPLVRDGLVVLQVDELDRRSRRVLLTEAGLRKYEDARVVSKQMAVRFDEVFGAQAACELRKAMDFIASDEFARALLGKGG